MHHARAARMIARGIPVGLQNTFELTEEMLRTFAAAPHPEVKDDTSSWCAILPDQRRSPIHTLSRISTPLCLRQWSSLVILPALIVRLHPNRCLVGLNITSAE